MPDTPARQDTHDPGAAGREAWQRTRRYLNTHRYELTRRVAAQYPAERFAPGTRMLARPHWIPDAPVPLAQVRLRWSEQCPGTPIRPDAPELAALLPPGPDGHTPAGYSAAVGSLARPRLFENRSCYRLLDVAPGPALTFGRGRYFDLIDTCEAVAHEYAAAVLADPRDPGPTPFRTALGDPTDLRRRPVMAAVCTLVIRHDRTTGHADLLLHWRDPAKVATGGGLYQVMPVGMFQPSHDAPFNEANDFDLWRAILRELSEELLGTGEDYGSAAAPIDYDAWPLHRTLSRARSEGTLRLHWLGLGMDPLTYVTDLLTVAVFDAGLFDDTFARLAAANDEGHRIDLEDGTGRSLGIPFRADHIQRLTRHEPMQPAGSALLHLAWQHREALLP